DAPHTSNGTPAPAPAAAKAAKATKKAATATATVSAWVEPTGDVCPTTHPVKGKLGSKIFHLPGMLNYERTRPDRCYRDGDAAEPSAERPPRAGRRPLSGGARPWTSTSGRPSPACSSASPSG